MYLKEQNSVVDLVKAELEIKKYLKIRYSNNRTINLYTKRFIDLIKYYPATEPINISELELNNYIKILINRKDSRSLIIQFIQVAEYYYNHIHKKSYVIYRKNLPKASIKDIDILSQEEIFLMIDNFRNPKHRVIFVLVYACCLDLSELLNIELSDLNTKKPPFHIRIRKNNSDSIRKVFISKKIVDYLDEYWKSCKEKPKQYLIESTKPKLRYSRASSEKVIKKSFEEAGISSASVIKALKRSYIKHMLNLGIPMIVILESLDIYHFDSIKKYTKIFHGNIKIDFTPLDKFVNKPSIIEPEMQDLEKIIFTLKEKDEQEYLLEAIQCFRIGALKAGIVFSWSAFIRILQNRCVELGFKEINTAAMKLKFTKKFSKITDFETIKEMNLLKLALELKVLSKHQKIQMDNNLDTRNHCGHPSSYILEINKAKGFIEDIVSFIKNSK
ncbi:tyrosine-type recombinase/integrase [uncultured Algibacter sp.]|uniref:tyrosine-type recombinase/integrase n=1 Tax=uncultured Algibacter sp. TaxID=298659 RepID=UPI0026041EA4|nr:tyrosine-type recombinase/integrase [uncultured Algibacter sp.]